jgi:DNA-binding FadR family transcriptional regulator
MMHPVLQRNLAKLRAYMAAQEFGLNDRLPPERELCVELGQSRAGLRQALGVLEEEGLVWRQVGRGTFVGARPVLNLQEVKFLSSITSPRQIIDARFSVEPELARVAATHGLASDLAELRHCHQRCQDARSWQVFEAWDNRFHYAIAAATKNKLLMTLFETLNAVRRSQVWRTMRVGSGPLPYHTTFREHAAVLQAVTARDGDAAASAMRAHLQSVQSRLLL